MGFLFSRFLILWAMKSVPQRGSAWLVEFRESLYPVRSHTLPRCGTDCLVTRLRLSHAGELSAAPQGFAVKQFLRSLNTRLGER